MPPGIHAIPSFVIASRSGDEIAGRQRQFHRAEHGHGSRRDRAGGLGGGRGRGAGARGRDEGRRERVAGARRVGLLRRRRGDGKRLVPGPGHERAAGAARVADERAAREQVRLADAERLELPGGGEEHARDRRQLRGPRERGRARVGPQVGIQRHLPARAQDVLGGRLDRLGDGPAEAERRAADVQPVHPRPERAQRGAIHLHRRRVGDREPEVPPARGVVGDERHRGAALGDHAEAVEHHAVRSQPLGDRDPEGIGPDRRHQRRVGAEPRGDRGEDGGRAAGERPGPGARDGQPTVRRRAPELDERFADRQDHAPVTVRRRLVAVIER